MAFFLERKKKLTEGAIRKRKDQPSKGGCIKKGRSMHRHGRKERPVTKVCREKQSSKKQQSFKNKISGLFKKSYTFTDSEDPRNVRVDKRQKR